MDMHCYETIKGSAHRNFQARLPGPAQMPATGGPGPCSVTWRCWPGIFVNGGRRTLRLALYVLTGGGVFWLTDALFALAGGMLSTRLWVVAKTVILPLAVYLAVRTMTRLALPQRLPASGPFLMLTGIWLMGPLYSLIINRLYIKAAMGLGETLFHMALFPLSTLIIATYSGALGGLIIVSVYLVIMGLFTMYLE